MFDEIVLRDVAVRNRVWMSPMCQYSACEIGGVAGMPTDWHLAHLMTRACGGAGLIIVEATAVSPEARITPSDLGIWSDHHIAPLRRLSSAIREAGAVPAIQLAHAGRKASTDLPWRARGRRLLPEQGGWTPLGPVSDPVWGAQAIPVEQMSDIAEQFGAAARRAAAAGYEAVEIHGGHGYLLHQFLSPSSNSRTDAYGVDFAGRSRLAIDVFRSVRENFPRGLPVFFRLSATDWAPRGEPAWDLTQATRLAQELDTLGVDLIDVTSGGLIKGARIDVFPGYQVPFARHIKQAVSRSAVSAVGKITDPTHAESIVGAGDADVVLVGRALLEEPYWVRNASRAVRIPFPDQYEWAVGPRGNSDFTEPKSATPTTREA
ncbi:hypothetical protein BVC93_16550 [Mycobacterium sp. MS1601]|nr:hypothetical protein BVC93_16550 [Mycobacterium sp. MS1601]